MNRYLIAVLFGLVPALLVLPNERASIPQFIDITPTSGIKFRHLNGDANLKNYIFEAKGGGARSWILITAAGWTARAFRIGSRGESGCRHRALAWRKTQEFKGVAGNQHYVINEERGLQKERFAGK